MQIIKRIKPGRIITAGFALLIIIGAILLSLPIAHNEGVDVSFIDALFTSTSAVCVTGLIVVDTADTFNVFGRTIVAILIQIGGLGITSFGVGIIILTGRHVGIKKEHWLRKQ